MNLPRLAVKRPVATGAILVLILLVGLVSLYQSPLDLLPDIQPPVLAVITAFPGSSPQESLQLVTRPVEDAVSAVSGLTNMLSFSQESMSLVILQFNWGIDVDSVRDSVGMRLDLLNLPDGVQKPMVLKFDPTLMPIMAVSASGASDNIALTQWLEETATPRIETIPGVASVQLQGGVKQDLFVRIAPEVMADYEVSFEQVASILRTSLLDLPAGIIDLEDRSVRIRFLGRFAEADLLSELIVGFQVDQEALEEMIGREVDINLNQLLGDPEALLSSGGGGGDLLNRVPMRKIYWDDFIDFDRGRIVGSNLIIPLSNSRVFGSDDEVASRLRVITVNPAIDYQAENRSLNFSLDTLGHTIISTVEGGLGVLPIPELVRLKDIWIIGGAVWDGSRIILPVDPISMERYNIDDATMARLAGRVPLITEANSRYILVALHEDWERMRREPIVSLPDLESFVADVGRDVEQGIGDVTGQIEEGLTELAIAMIIGSMSPGGGAAGFGGITFEEDFPINAVSLGMLADIEQDTYSPTSITRYNQEPSITMVIQKEGDANTVQVARQIRRNFDDLSEESSGNFSRISFNTMMDQAEEIESALADLAWALAGGAVLAIFVLVLFLKNWRTTMFIALSIPAAVITTFTLLYFTEITINLMTLGGLALAAGMLVDNAIVVSENIYRHYQMGKSAPEAAMEGAQEVAGAITASTLTTISVFFPVIFLSGLAGQLFWEFALTVACAILASLLVALTVIPMLASRSLDAARDRKRNGFSVPRLPAYRRLLHHAVCRPWWVLIFAAVFVGLAAIGFSTLGTELFPQPDESSFRIDMNLPPGSTMSTTDAYTTRLEETLATREEIVSFSSIIGGGGFMGLPGAAGNANQARLRVEMDPVYLGEIESIIDSIRGEVDDLGLEAEIVFSRESLLGAAGLESTLDLVVAGTELDRITAITAEAVAILREHPQFADVQSSLEESLPEIHIRLDQSDALQKGVTQLTVATAVRQALEGIPVSRIETAGGILNVVLGYEREEIKTLEDLGRIGFYTPGGEYVRLEEVATLTEAFGPRSIPRENQQVVGQIQMQYGDLDLGSATTEALTALEVIDLPEGYEIKTAGSSTLMDDVLEELQLVVVMAALLVYLVMAAQFESLLHPFMIILSLPLAYAGSILALIITGQNISVPAMIGIVVLSGILVNDGIIMVDFINQQRRIHGRPLREAIIEGATARLRPILMTTATTVLGLLPLALGFGEGGQLQAPMAITIIGGQITGTILLLVAIPSVYVVLTREKALCAEEWAEGAERPVGPVGSLGPLGPLGPVGPVGPVGPEGSEEASRALDPWSEKAGWRHHPAGAPAYGNVYPASGREHRGPAQRPLTKLILRVTVIALFMLILLILFSIGGEGLLAVIR